MTDGTDSVSLAEAPVHSEKIGAHHSRIIVMKKCGARSCLGNGKIKRMHIK